MRTQLLVLMLLTTCVTASLAQEAKTAEAELTIGDAAPDFNLPTFEDKSVTLSDHFGEDGHPVILLFSRANW